MFARVPLLWVSPLSKLEPTKMFMPRKMQCCKVFTMAKR